MNIPFIKRYVLLIGIFWTLACSVALISHFRDDHRQRITRIETRAKTMLERDILYRDWAASHGGVYAPITEASPPNPHLEFLPERDVETLDGLKLTLINPSYMTSQAFDLGNRSGETTSKITSLKVLNPDNAPDSWERDALRQLDEGRGLVSGLAEVSGRTYLRTIRPFYIESACLKCHAEQGYRLGDVRGGLSISIPFESFWSGSWRRDFISIGLFCLLWLLGVVGIVLLGRKLYRQTCLAIEHEQQRDRAEMRLDFASYYDRSTNLPNRFKFEEQLHELFSQVDASGNFIAVTVLEILNYKKLLNNFDHPVSDAFFRVLAERVALLLSPEDSVARFGEERLIFSYTCSDEKLFMEKLLPQLYAGIGKSLAFESHEFFPVACMGVAFYPNDSVDAKHLVRKAVSALTFCLEQKQGGTTLYSQSLQDEAKSRLEIESGLRRALAEDGFELFLQPQVDAASGGLTGAEALLRWNQEGRGYVSPALFIPVIEENGLILPIGEWVLHTACAQAVKLKERFKRVIPIGVNVSANQFQDPNFMDIIDKVLAIDGMSPEMLEIEITEGTFIEDIDRTIEILVDLKVRGLQIAIDDFGTGYSSLSYLNKFPIDRLKVDRSFVVDIASNKDDRLLVGLIVEMGRKLGLNVIAEGVEDDTQRNLLIGMGCHSIQGFLFCRPLNFDDFCRWFDEECGNLADAR